MMKVSTSTLTTIGLLVSLLLVSRLIDFADTTTLRILRVMYATSQALLFSIFYSMKIKIDALPDTNATSADAGHQSMKEHDLTQWRSKRKQLLITLAVILFLHFYLHLPQPLFMQSILPWKLMYSSPLFQVYTLGKRAEGPLARPWSADKKKTTPLTPQVIKRETETFVSEPTTPS